MNDRWVETRQDGDGHHHRPAALEKVGTPFRGGVGYVAFLRARMVPRRSLPGGLGTVVGSRTTRSVANRRTPCASKSITVW
jgi:hypothetical protein